jgi:hypothetical protein
VHTHQGRPIIGGCGSPNYVQNDVEKIGQNNKKVRKDGRAISEIQAQWASGILSKNMLKNV